MGFGQLKRVLQILASGLNLMSAKHQWNIFDLSKFLACQSKLFRASNERLDISERKKILYGLMTISNPSFAVSLKRQHFIDVIYR